jgi:DNA-binding MarR family transcriptional regulator
VTRSRTRPNRAAMDHLRYLVVAAQREGSRMLNDGLRHLELTPAQAEVLDVLAEHQPVTLAELGRLLVCELTSPSRLVDAMVRRGLVSRVPHPHDKRAVTVELTAHGQELAARLDGATALITDFIADRLTSTDIDTLAGLLTKLLADTRNGDALRHRFPAGH